MLAALVQHGVLRIPPAELCRKVGQERKTDLAGWNVHVSAASCNLRRILRLHGCTCLQRSRVESMRCAVATSSGNLAALDAGKTVWAGWTPYCTFYMAIRQRFKIESEAQP